MLVVSLAYIPLGFEPLNFADKGIAGASGFDILGLKRVHSSLKS